MAEKIFNGRELMARVVSKPNIIGIIFFIMIWAISEVFLIGVIAGLFARWTVRKYDRTVINQIPKTSLRTPNTISYDIPEVHAAYTTHILVARMRFMRCLRIYAHFARKNTAKMNTDLTGPL